MAKVTHPQIRVRMTIPDNHPGVHDGAGNMHMPGTSPFLPSSVAKAFVEKKLAVYVESVFVRYIREKGAHWQLLDYRDKLATLSFALILFSAVATAIPWFLRN